MIFFKKLFKELINEIKNPSSLIFKPKTHDFIQLDKELKKNNAFIVLDNNKYVLYQDSIITQSPFILAQIKHTLPTENIIITQLLLNNDYNFLKDFIAWKQQQLRSMNFEVTLIQDSDNREISFKYYNQPSPLFISTTPNFFHKEMPYELYFLYNYFNISKNIFPLSKTECFNQKIKKEHLINNFRSACEKIIYAEDFKI